MRAALLATLVLATLLGGCRPPADGGSSQSSGASAAGRSVEAEVVGQPRTGEAEVRVRVLDDGAPVGGAAVTVTGNMTHAGMAPVIVEATETGDGAYLTEGFEFTMAGDWIITVDVVYPDGGKLSRNLTLNVPGG